ncbi:MAG: dockerin type I domain-containing protein [Phycisphaerae bacterium]
MRKLLATSALVLTLTTTATATAADFMWQPICPDADWEGCCGEMWDWQNNWGQASVGAFCPFTPGIADTATIGVDIYLLERPVAVEVGVLVHTGGTITLASSGGLRIGSSAEIFNLDLQSGPIFGSGIYLNGPTVLSGPGTKAFGKTNQSSQLVNLGTITWNSGPFELRGTDNGIAPPQSTFTNATGAVIDMRSDDMMLSVNRAVLVNQGTVRRSAGTGASVIEASIDNTGTIHAEVGRIELRRAPSGPGSGSSGVLSAAPGASVDVFGPQFELLAGASLAGDVRVFSTGAAATNLLLNHDMTVARLAVMSNARVGGNGLYRVSERLDMAGAAFTPEIRVLAGGHLDVTSVVEPFQRPLRISGTARLGPGAAIGFTQQVVNVQVPGRLDLEDGSAITSTGFVTHGVVVSGILRKVETSGTATISNQSAGITFVNATGRIELLGGELSVTGPMTTAGTIVVADGATLSASGGAFTANAGSTFTGSGTLSVGGSVNLSSSTIAPGDTTGTLSIVGTPGDVLLGGASVLNSQLGGAAAGQFDVLSVSGAITLDGTLNLTLVNGFVPQVGQTFAVVTAGSLSGTFATITGTDLGGGRELQLSYTGTSVVVTVTGEVTPGDVNGDGTVNLTDLSLLLAAFGTCSGDAAFNADADINDSGCVDLVDLSQLLANFGT